MAAAMRFASAHATDAAALTAPPSTPAWTALPAGARQRGIMVIGPTGSGKSRLAIELAAAVGGEVINADVVQMYSGLDVASAKVPASDRAGVPHHLMSFLPPRAAFDVRAFRRMAAAAAADAASRGRVPVVAGGTLYYAQALLRSSLLEEDEAAAVAATVAEAGAVLPRVDGSAAGATSEEPYDRLRRVDAVMAERLHPRDGRKIARALAVFDATGVPYSEVIRRQAARLDLRRQAPPSAAQAGNVSTEGRPGGVAGAPAVPPFAAQPSHGGGNDGGGLSIPPCLTAAHPALLACLTAAHPALLASADPPAIPHEPAPAAAATPVVASADAADAASAPAPTARAEAETDDVEYLVVHLGVADRTVLDARLDRRVDTMVAGGLVDEVRALWERLRAIDGVDADCGGVRADAAVVMSSDVAAHFARSAFATAPVPRDEPSALTLRLLRAAGDGIGGGDGGCDVPPEAHTAAVTASETTMSGEADASTTEELASRGGPAAALAFAPAPPERRYDGVLQAIGFKEFEAYFSLLDGGGSGLNGAQQGAAAGGLGGAAGRDAVAAALAASLASVRAATHRYARRQEHWIRNRFARRGVRMLTLDTGAAEAEAEAATMSRGGGWDAAVRAPALAAAKAWLAGADDAAAFAVAGAAASDAPAAGAPTAPAPPLPDDATRLFAWRKHACAPCDRVLNGDAEWAAHMTSRGHARAVAAERKRAQLAAERGIVLPRGKRGRPVRVIDSAVGDSAEGGGAITVRVAAAATTAEEVMSPS